MASTKCKFCGSSVYGACTKSENKYHKHGSDGKHCIYCGSATVNATCTKSPHRSHER